MRIKKVVIENYGPLRNFSLSLGNFDLVFGLNESGKTALVEALSYTLFKRNPTVLRYGKPKDVSVEIEKNEKYCTLPTRKVSIDLPPSDIANLFYVQASESLVYSPGDEARFWDGIKALFSKIGKRITFTKLDAKIFDSVGLTPKRADWKEDKQQLIHSLENRKNELEKYLKKISDNEKKENELSRLTEKAMSLKTDLAKIEAYRSYKNYQELSNLYDEYREKKTHLQEYERYKYEYFTKWQELETKVELRQDDEKKLKEVKKEIVELQKDLMELNRKEGIVEAEGFTSYIAQTGKEFGESPMMYPIIALAVSTILLVLSFLTPIPVFPVAIIFLVSCAFVIYFYRKTSLARKMLIEKNKMFKKAKKLFPDISSLPELTTKIKAMQEMKIKKETLLSEKLSLKKHLSKGEAIAKAEKEIANLRSKTGLADIADLKGKIDKKRALEGNVNELAGRISGMLSEKNDKRWEKLIKDKKTAQPKEKLDPTQETDIKNDLKKLQEKIDNLTSEIRIFRDTLTEKFNIADARTAFLEYDQLQRRLADYSLEKKAALAARKILEKMSSELDQFIQDMVKGDESLSEYFRLVTDLYDEVEVRNKSFYAKRKDGTILDIEKLSSGAQDQLLLCFRISALKKLYPEGSFLILDDAFIFADWNRRKKLVTLLKKFIEHGNQVVYLTSDDHTRDLFKEHGAKITTI